MKNRFTGSLIFLIVAVALVMGVAQASAFGITSMYWKERPLELKPGQTTTVTLELQNMVGTEAVTLEGRLISGGEVAKITDVNTTYYVPSGSKDVLIHLMITIPDDAPLGTEYNVGVSLLEVNVGGQGVSMGSEIEKYFPVIIKMPASSASASTPVSEEKTSAWLVILVIVIAIILALVIMLLVNKKKKK